MGASIRLDSRAVAADPFPVYERLRREAPVFRTRMRMSSLGDAEVFALSRYRDCVDLITDDRMRRTVKGPESLWLPKAFQLVTTDSMIVKDRPEHSRLRKLASRMFSRIATARMSDRIDTVTGNLLDGFTPGQQIDLQADYAVPIASTVLSKMICADEADQERFHDVSGMLGALWMPQHGIEQMLARVERTAAFVREMIERRRAEPADDIMTVLVHANEDGDTLSDDEIIAMVLLSLAKLFADNGVPMMTGTDGGSMMAPGLTLRQEFAELAKAGLSPLKILQMTTINPAQYLGRQDTMGTVEPGRNADLVVLDANPLDDVQNLHRINAVIRAGTHFSAAELAALKVRVSASAEDNR
jgi:Amidohydrolase family